MLGRFLIDDFLFVVVGFMIGVNGECGGLFEVNEVNF